MRKLIDISLGVVFAIIIIYSIIAKSDYTPLLSAVAGFIAGFVSDYIKNRLEREELGHTRDAFFVFASGNGLLVVIISFLFTSEYIPWEALFGLLIAFQSQLSLIYYRLGEISGKISE